MTITLIALLTIWTVVVPTAVLLLRLRAPGGAVEIELGELVEAPVRKLRVGNMTHSCQDGRRRRVAYTATHVDSRCTKDRFDHRPGGTSKRG
jgi:hypothetical protein